MFRKPCPSLSDHGSEIALLAVIAIGACILAGVTAYKGHGEAAAAWSTILMGIVNAIKERWQARTIDRMGQQLGLSAPPTNAQEETPK